MEENQYSYDHPDTGYRQNSPPQRRNGLTTAALILGIFAVAMCSTGIAFVIGAVGILLALLSRGSGKMDSQARIGLILSSGGAAVSLGIYIFSVVSLVTSGELQDMLQSYYEYYYYGETFEEDNDVYDNGGAGDDSEPGGDSNDYDDFYDYFDDYFDNGSGGTGSIEL